MGIMRNTDTSREQSRKDTRSVSDRLDDRLEEVKKRQRERARKKREERRKREVGRNIKKEVEKKKKEKEKKDRVKKATKKRYSAYQKKVDKINETASEENKKRVGNVAKAVLGIYTGNTKLTAKGVKGAFSGSELSDYEKQFIEDKKLKEGVSYTERASRIARGKEKGVIRYEGNTAKVDKKATEKLKRKLIEEERKKEVEKNKDTKVNASDDDLRKEKRKLRVKQGLTVAGTILIALAVF